MNKLEVNDHIGLIMKITSEAFHKHQTIRAKYEFEELLSENVIKTYSLIETFDGRKGAKFSTYLYKSLNHHMHRLVFRDKHNYTRSQKNGVDTTVVVDKVSLNEVVKNDVGTNERGDFIASSQSLESEVVSRTYLQDLFSKFDEMDRIVLEKYFVDDCVQRQISIDMNISATRVSNIMTASLLKLKGDMENEY